MLKNYLKIGFRNLAKNSLFTVINISGMAISIASFLIIALYITDELKFDRHVNEVDQKYRVYCEHFNDDGSKRKGAMISPMIAPTLASEYPEVDYYFRFLNFNNPLLFERGDKKLTEAKGGYGDPRFFDMFSLELVEGDRAKALTEPGTIVISESLRKKYFGEKPAVGETIEVNNGPLKVAAVYRDFSPHSHFQINYVLAMRDFEAGFADRMKRWGWNQFHTYIKLKPEANAAEFEAKLKGFAERNAWPSTKPNGGYYIPHIMPMRDIHLMASDHAWDIAVRGNQQTVYIMSGTALFILLIAILNFVNLSTARAVSRVKEVGVRKVVGAFRRQLIYQFISESVIVALIALIIGGLITELLLPSLNSFTEKSIPSGIFLDPLVIVALLIFAVVVGLAAGAYPAFHISGYKPAQILANKSTSRSGNTIFRKGLVVLQFILSFFLIIASIIVSDQHQFMRTADMGFDKNNVVVLQLRGEMAASMDAAKNAFSDHQNVLSATLGYGLPGEAFAGDGIIDKATGKDWHISMLIADHDYAKTMGLEIIAGRDFSKDRPSDQFDAFILSETAAKMLGHTDPADAIGHEIAWNQWRAPDTLKQGAVIGVMKDIQLNSMRENVSPVVLHIYPFGYSSLTLKIKPTDVPATLAHFEKTWKKFNTEWPFQYRFLDDNFDRMYKAEEKLATLFTFFTGFTIFVACLGLFGLVVYSTTQRYREISIRKVLGAEEMSLVVQLAKAYVLLIAIAFVIAIPLSYYATQQWLQKFAFHIPVTAMLFVKAGVVIMTISLITVGIQSMKAARANPVDALKEQ